MKKIIFTYFLILHLLVYFGCQRTDTDPIQCTKTGNTIERLEAYNATLTSSVHTRGYSRQDFLKAICIAAADIGGMATGISAVKEIAFVLSIPTGGIGAAVTCGFAGLVCCVGASYGAHAACYPQTRSCDSCVINPNIILESLLVSDSKYKRDTTLHILPSLANSIRLPQEYESIRNYGIRHNQALVTLEEIKSGEIDLQDLNLDPELETIITSNEFNVAYGGIVNAAISATSTDHFDITEFLGSTGSYLSGKTTQVLELFFEVYTLYPEDEQDIAELINNYISIIEESSDFTNEEKEYIYASLMVAAESPLHWQEIIN